jgi:hypothetical protein
MISLTLPSQHLTKTSLFPLQENWLSSLTVALESFQLSEPELLSLENTSERFLHTETTHTHTHIMASLTRNTNKKSCRVHAHLTYPNIRDKKR